MNRWHSDDLTFFAVLIVFYFILLVTASVGSILWALVR
jgi:hypothetical protein